MTDSYSLAEVQRLLSEDESIAEQGIEVTCVDDVITVRGTVETGARRDAIGQRVRDLAGVARVTNEITVAGHASPRRHEELT